MIRRSGNCCLVHTCLPNILSSLDGFHLCIFWSQRFPGHWTLLPPCLKQQTGKTGDGPAEMEMAHLGGEAEQSKGRGRACWWNWGWKMVLQLPERCFKPYGGKITTSFTKIGEFRGKNKQTNKPLQGLGGGKQGGNFRHLPVGEGLRSRSAWLAPDQLLGPSL